MKYSVIITKKHCIGTDYLNACNCPLFVAIKEQYPGFPLFCVGDTFIRTMVEDNGNKVSNVIQFQESAFTVAALSAGDWWSRRTVNQLLNGELDRYIVEFEAPEYNTHNDQAQEEANVEFVKQHVRSEALTPIY